MHYENETILGEQKYWHTCCVSFLFKLYMTDAVKDTF